MSPNGQHLGLKILMVSGCFPPYNVIGSLRVGKMAKYLLGLGNDVRVLTVKDQPFARALELEIPEERVAYTPWLNVNRPVEALLGGRETVAAKGYSVSSNKPSILSNILRLSGRAYKSVLNVPDNYVGWYWYAVRHADQLMSTWRPDVIYASASPYTSHLVAKRLSQKHGIPWVAELRDLWVDSHYYHSRGLRRQIDSRLETRTLSTARGIVTVSEVWAQSLEKKYAKPVAVVYNGFDPSDYPNVGPSKSNVLRIAHTGMIYEGKRDPTPLFKAIASLGPLSDSVKVSFYGRYLGSVIPLAKKYGVEHAVEVCGVVPHKESIRVQVTSDVLLLLLWDDPGEQGTYTGKLYEYLGARRPLLVVGPSESLASKLVQRLGAGVSETDPGKIAQHLRKWLATIQGGEVISSTPDEGLSFLTRSSQAEQMDRFLRSLVHET